VTIEATFFEHLDEWAPIPLLCCDSEDPITASVKLKVWPKTEKRQAVGAIKFLNVSPQVGLAYQRNNVILTYSCPPRPAVIRPRVIFKMLGTNQTAEVGI